MRRILQTITIKNHITIGVLYDLVTSFNGVLSIRHCRSFGSLRSAYRLPLRWGSLTSSARSTGLRSQLSTVSREAPLINRERTGLVLCSDSTLLTARCRGVNPSQSWSSRVFIQLSIQTRVISAYEQAAQWSGVLPLLSRPCKESPRCLKKQIEIGSSPQAATWSMFIPQLFLA